MAIDDPDKPAWTMNFFTGAPAPAGAGLAMAPMYLGFLGFVADGHTIAWLVLPYIVAVALLMVSRVPTFSGKTLGSRISRDLVLPILGLAALAVVLLIAFTWEMLTAMAALYIVMLPVSIALLPPPEGELRAAGGGRAPGRDLPAHRCNGFFSVSEQAEAYSTRSRSAQISSASSRPTEKRNTPSPAKSR